MIRKLYKLGAHCARTYIVLLPSYLKEKTRKTLIKAAVFINHHILARTPVQCSKASITSFFLFLKKKKEQQPCSVIKTQL